MNDRLLEAKPKQLARIVGALYIVGTVAGVLSAVVSGPALSQLGEGTTLAREAPMIVGALLVLLMGFSLAMIPVVLFPVVRRVNEIVALGAVLFRGALEAVAYVAVALLWLGFVTIGRVSAGAGAAGAAGGFDLRGWQALLLGAQEWTTLFLAIVFCLGAFMIYGLFYASRLVPRWLSAWGLVGGVLYLSVPFLGLAGWDGFGALMAPLAVQEMVLAAWLILRGFDGSALAALSSVAPQRRGPSRSWDAPSLDAAS